MIPQSLLKEPYQYYGDSPTIKKYTLWKLYDYYIVKLAKNQIPLGGSSGKFSEEYDIVYDGTSVKSNRAELYETKPLGIISPMKDKLSKIHYYLIKSHAYRVVLRNGDYKLLFTAPLYEAVIPQHLIIDVYGKTSLELDLDYKNTRSLRSTFIELHLHDSSKLNLLINLNDSINSPSNINIGIKQEKYTLLNLLYLTIAGKMTRFTITDLLDGEDSESNIRGTVFTTKQNRIDNITDIVSRNRDTYSKYLFTSLVSDKGVVGQRGVGKIYDNAWGSGIEYYSEALLLSDDAKAYLQPRLEIDTGDVKIAKHAARNIHILPEQIFYLQTRGIDYDSARKLVITGYLIKEIPTTIYTSKIISSIKKVLDSIIT
ncbi:SufD family Fe-S cluster assembly protein [Staphylothermus hellenicus]|nr:SufD family Fe-S cluster assembly protein [Staphylothermus hellenicus]